MTKLHLPAAALGWNTLERSVKVLLLRKLPACFAAFDHLNFIS